MKASTSPRFQASLCTCSTASTSLLESRAAGHLQPPSPSSARTSPAKRARIALLVPDVAQTLELLQRRGVLGRARLFLDPLADREHGLRVREGLDARVHHVDRLGRPFAAQELAD